LHAICLASSVFTLDPYLFRSGSGVVEGEKLLKNLVIVKAVVLTPSASLAKLDFLRRTVLFDLLSFPDDGAVSFIIAVQPIVACTINIRKPVSYFVFVDWLGSPRIYFGPSILIAHFFYLNVVVEVRSSLLMVL
jgi:hypothetical protein